MELATGNYFYDIQWEDGSGTVKTFMSGNFTISFDDAEPSIGSVTVQISEDTFVITTLSAQ